MIVEEGTENFDGKKGISTAQLRGTVGIDQSHDFAAR